MAAALYSILADAIRQKFIVTADYHGHSRIMCPHALGTKRGKEHLLAYQFAGSSSQGLGPDGSGLNWRCMDIVQLSNVTTSTGAWHTASNHTKRQTCIDIVAVEVKP